MAVRHRIPLLRIYSHIRHKCNPQNKGYNGSIEFFGCCTYAGFYCRFLTYWIWTTLFYWIIHNLYNPETFFGVLWIFELISVGTQMTPQNKIVMFFKGFLHGTHISKLVYGCFLADIHIFGAQSWVSQLSNDVSHVILAFLHMDLF